MLTDNRVKELEKLANQIRQEIIKDLVKAGSGHSAGPLGMADVLTTLYFEVIKHNPKKPDWPERDRVVLSHGHICPVLYAVMAFAGYFPKEELLTLRKLNTRLQGHPHNLSLPGIENTSGPLGQGFSQAIGMALAAKLNEEKHRIYVLMGDGEQQEGQTMEAYMFAGKNKLNNLTALIDRNNIQIDGYTEDVMPLEPFAARLAAFNWHVLEVDGHNIQSIYEAFMEAKTIFEKPTVIIAHTIPGKGVTFMENKFEWHGKPPTKEEARKALRDLRTLGGRIKSEHE